MVICCTSYNTVIAEATYVEMHMLKNALKEILLSVIISTTTMMMIIATTVVTTV